MPRRERRWPSTSYCALTDPDRGETKLVRLFGLKSCDACRQASRWLRDQGVDYEYVDIRDNGLTDDVIRQWQSRASWEAMINRRSITWRKIPAVDRQHLDPDSARRLILAYPTVLHRPVLELPDRVLLGFDEAVYEEALGSS